MRFFVSASILALLDKFAPDFNAFLVIPMMVGLLLALLQDLKEIVK